jgi:hypothetical protein
MRTSADVDKLRDFMREIGARARGAGRVYLTGGATALLFGFRARTIDIDIKLDPEPAGVFEAIADLKELLQVNVELASPDDFIPALPGWRERSRFIGRHGSVDFYHYDFYGQALAKVERGHEQDRSDVADMIRTALVDPRELLSLFIQVEPDLVRFPAIDGRELRARLQLLLPQDENEQTE